MKKVLICMHINANSQRRFLAGASNKIQPHHRGWTVVLDAAPEKMTLQHWNEYVKSGISGAILCESFIPDLDAIIRTAKVPVVIFGSPRGTEGSPHAPHGFVMSDDTGIGAAGAEHFAALGKFRSYGFVPDPGNAGWSQGHQKGFVQCLRKEKIDVSVFSSPAQGVSRHRSLEDWVKALAKPAAVMTACDELGLDTISACRRAGLSVPKHVSVIGVGNNVIMDELAIPALTSIDVNHEEEGALAVTMLAGLMRSKKKAEPKVAVSKVVEVVVRDSTGPVAPAAHLIRRALEYINANAHRAIKVDDVAAHCNISRRLLDLRFRQFHGESVNSAIMSARLDEVRSRLLASNLSPAKLAASCGFGNIYYLKRLFFKKFGVEMQNMRLSP